MGTSWCLPCVAETRRGRAITTKSKTIKIFISLLILKKAVRFFMFPKKAQRNRNQNKSLGEVYDRDSESLRKDNA